MTRLTLTDLQNALLDDLDEAQFDVLRDDESLCIRRYGEPVVYLRLEENEEQDRQEAGLNVAANCNPAIAAYLALVVNDHVFATVDIEYLFTATKVQEVELMQ
jgi:hypothetical protein